MIKKILISGVLVTTIFAAETQYGHGTIGFKGGFLGLTSTKSMDISTYSLIEQHKNIFKSNWFYKYNLTWYDSDKMVVAQETINDYANGFLNPPTKTFVMPAVDYRMQGLDINVAIGKDIIKKDENNYFGIGLMVGISLPWIESKKNDSNNDINK